MLVTSLILPRQFTFSHSRTTLSSQSRGAEFAPTVFAEGAASHSATVGGPDLPSETSGAACPAPGAASEGAAVSPAGFAEGAGACP
jgi:hypothetical protein